MRMIMSLITAPIGIRIIFLCFFILKINVDICRGIPHNAHMDRGIGPAFNLNENHYHDNIY